MPKDGVSQESKGRVIRGSRGFDPGLVESGYGVWARSILGSK